MTEASPLILFGRPTPWRGIWGSVIMGFTRTWLVSSFSPFASPYIEREWIRYLLPYTGLPRDPHSQLSAPFGAPSESHATLEQAQRFAHEYLK